MTLDHVLGLYNYWIVIFLMMTGFYIVISSKNLIKAIIGLNIFQTSVFLLYITMGKVDGGTAPIIPPALADQQDVAHGDHTHGDHAHGEAAHAAADHLDHASDHVENHVGELTQHAQHLASDAHAASEAIIYSHPLPSVLMLTAIVVGIATTALALALIVRIREEYGTIEEDEILALDRRA
tara:strand:+ start:107153 stop:107695 length:543 start_codon:yes stop_codon:yes gene_type:complete